MSALWSLICSGVGYVLRFCYMVIPNYGVALLLFALLFKLILLPTGIKQQKNQILQAKLRPKEMAIRKKYKNTTDRVIMQKMQMEIQEMYQREGFSPAAGCLPMLLQMPIIFALYSVVRSPLTYISRFSSETLHVVLTRAQGLARNANAAFVNFQNEIEAINVMRQNPDHFADVINEIPNFDFICWDLTATPSFSWNLLLLIPVLTFVIMYGTMALQQRVTYQASPNPDAAKSMMIMNLIMPAMSTYFTFIVPSALGVYWMFQNIFGAVQQVVLAKTMPLPQFTEEDYKKAEQELRGKSGKRKNRPNGANDDPDRIRPRSLHRIDEYEPTEPPAPKKKEAPVSTTARPKVQNNSLVDGVSLKEEPKHEKAQETAPQSVEETIPAVEETPVDAIEAQDTVVTEAPMEEEKND